MLAARHAFIVDKTGAAHCADAADYILSLAQLYLYLRCHASFSYMRQSIFSGFTELGRQLSATLFSRHSTMLSASTASRRHISFATFYMRFVTPAVPTMMPIQLFGFQLA